MMRIAIAGAGQVGQSIARELIANGHQVTLIERDHKSVKQDSVLGAEWLQADACELSSLEASELDKFHVAIAATGDDKSNLVFCLLAKTEFSVPRTVARVNHPGNEWLFDHRWGVDAAVSTPRLMSALVEEAVGAGNLVRILTLQDSGMHLSEATIADDSDHVGKAVGELQLPDEATLVTLSRGGKPRTPEIDERLKVGDKLFFLATENAESDLEDLFLVED